jgi:hypothetical protein
MIRRTLIVIALLGTSVTSVSGQRVGTILTAEQRKDVVDSIANTLDHMYVFPDVAKRIDADLHARLDRGEFNHATDDSSFAQLLTQKLQAISHDKHLRVGVLSSDPMSPAGSSGRHTPLFGRTERMGGDVAYIEILGFRARPEEMRDETRRIMSAAADARALIIDLRENGGGSPYTVALISSYLFGAEPVQVTSLYFRRDDRMEDVFTNPLVAGTRFGPDKPVYVLTSSKTFSAAEEFAYNLQTRNRATIIGEATAGGANPGRGVLLPYNLNVFVPIAREINPITKTNWDGIGVQPDIAVPAADALDIAHNLAIK